MHKILRSHLKVSYIRKKEMLATRNKYSFAILKAFFSHTCFSYQSLIKELLNFLVELMTVLKLVIFIGTYHGFFTHHIFIQYVPQVFHFGAIFEVLLHTLLWLSKGIFLGEELLQFLHLVPLI